MGEQEITGQRHGRGAGQRHHAGCDLVHLGRDGELGLLLTLVLRGPEQAVISSTLLLVAEDVVSADDLPKPQRRVGISRVEVGMALLDRLAERCPDVVSVVVRKSSEQIVKRLHDRSRCRFPSSPIEIPTANLRWSTRTNTFRLARCWANSAEK